MRRLRRLRVSGQDVRNRLLYGSGVSVKYLLQNTLFLFVFKQKMPFFSGIQGTEEKIYFNTLALVVKRGIVVEFLDIYPKRADYR